ncbi:MAG: helix-turn-helix transcriptional regulator, partial [Verrucomicrobia bacterium]|nr:helix-turn-helix transcriptional regulator [Verrucomicrobiota bacterium]
ERHMRRALKAAEGQNFSKMLQEIRLGKACEMLGSSEWSIAEVALEVGFGEQSYFSKLFKTKYGMSPSEYREKGGD